MYRQIPVGFEWESQNPRQFGRRPRTARDISIFSRPQIDVRAISQFKTPYREAAQKVWAQSAHWLLRWECTKSVAAHGPEAQMGSIEILFIQYRPTSHRHYLSSMPPPLLLQPRNSVRHLQLCLAAEPRWPGRPDRQARHLRPLLCAQEQQGNVLGVYRH